MGPNLSKALEFAMTDARPTEVGDYDRLLSHYESLHDSLVATQHEIESWRNVQHEWVQIAMDLRETLVTIRAMASDRETIESPINRLAGIAEEVRVALGEPAYED